ncbi:hypothetical protein FBZ89_104266 [Nitrospirillum amazonense]|uniref:Uncharacterized protein n=1 Tax=Nitrospirillum amazonense TaxID=28077 RepID=A0A560FKA2_9PROT|nr:hypothetical protein [Nitrospirillum amazonense]TWB22018.1 hypothetical protein FBZ89_104266 [Nitrospirillum amazonense]
MADTVTVNHRWLRDDALALLLNEANCDMALLNQTSDPQRARILVAGLCLIRRSDTFRQAFEKELDGLRHKPGWGPFYSWMIMTKFQVTQDPDEWPFALTDREFDYYATKNFGGKMPDIQGIYNPPSFYSALAQDIFAVGAGVVVGAVATTILPEVAGAAALSGAALSTATARATVSTALGAITSHLMPGGAWEAARLGRLWPRYMNEYNRRMMR